MVRLRRFNAPSELALLGFIGSPAMRRFASSVKGQGSGLAVFFEHSEFLARQAIPSALSAGGGEPKGGSNHMVAELHQRSRFTAVAAPRSGAAEDWPRARVIRVNERSTSYTAAGKK